MRKLVAVAMLWVSVAVARARYRIHHYVLGEDEARPEVPGITICIRRGKWLHYYIIGGRQL